VWWYTPVVPALRKLKQEEQKFEASLGYISLSQKKKKKKKREKKRKKENHLCQGAPHYSGCRDQEDCGSKPAQANSLRDLILKNPITKMGWWSGSKCRPSVQAPVPQKTNKQKTINSALLWSHSGFLD
jgi:hypothetical protein